MINNFNSNFALNKIYDLIQGAIDDLSFIGNHGYSQRSPLPFVIIVDLSNRNIKFISKLRLNAL